MDRKLLLILVLMLACGIALTVAAFFFGVFRFDLKVAFALMGEHNPVVSAIMAAVSFLGNGWVPLILVSLVAAFCAVKKKWVEATFVVATLISSAIISGVLKMLVSRPRPPGFSLNPYDLFQSFNQYSYPSGHVLFFVTFFGFVGFLAWKYLTGWKRWVTIAICAALIVLIGPSRIYLGKHWLSDVIGSYIIGTFWLIILILLYQLVLYRSNKMLEKEQVRVNVSR
jgi:membrane-associated phospholipid phosphatase